jgi:hypothetical protein
MHNFEHMTKEDGKIYGMHNTVTCINPHQCHFVAEYPDGKMIKGNDLFNTGWDNIPNGLASLRYFLSTGHVINIPRFKAYLPLIETSIGMDGSRMFHSISVKCLADNEVVVYRIILKQDKISKFKIGDIIVGKEKKPESFNKSWKFTG